MIVSGCRRYVTESSGAQNSSREIDPFFRDTLTPRKITSHRRLDARPAPSSAKLEIDSASDED